MMPAGPCPFGSGVRARFVQAEKITEPKKTRAGACAPALPSPCCLGPELLQHDDACADIYAIVQIDDVFIQHADAAG